MKKFVMLALATLIAPGSALPAGAASPEKSPREKLVGTWLQVSVDVVSADGTRQALYGDSPRGIVIYTSDGYFSLMQARVDLPKLASARPSTATFDEARAVVAGSIAYFGKYSLDETSNVLSVDIQASTFPNQVGDPTEKRTITSLTDDELRFTRHGVLPNTRLDVVFKRAK